MSNRLDALFPALSAKLPNHPLRVIGIDLGTTNSTVAELQWNPDNDLPDVRCIEVDQPTAQGRYTHVLVPSMLALYGEERWVGYGAKLLRSDPSAGLEQNANVFAEVKNDMGLARTYHRAPAHLRSAKAISREILHFLYDAAQSEDSGTIHQSVVTVPASFQAAQRQDTVDAAQSAGIVISEGALFDEPLAAFVDHVYHHADNATVLPEVGRSRNLLVFDFGGGTCDVAILKIGREQTGELIFRPLAVSRYHRLGGGDIDRAIIHEILIPQLLQQNGISDYALTYAEKLKYIQPPLLRVAESLKETLCIEIGRMRKFGTWAAANKAEVIRKFAGQIEIHIKDRTVVLHSPCLSAKQFDEVLIPFLDPYVLVPKQDEYRITCSIIAPLADALDRSELSRDRIDLVLLAGGSSLIPQIQDAVKSYFPAAQVLEYKSRDDAQTSIAKGAAVQALALAVTGRSLIRSVCHDDICFETQGDPYILVQRGEELPYPLDGDHRKVQGEFVTPEGASTGTVKITVSLVAGKEERRRLFLGTWQIPAPVKKGELLWLAYRYDANQVLSLKMGREDNATDVFVGEIQNPFTHVVNPNKTLAEVDDIEERLRTGKVPREEVDHNYLRLADLYRELRQFEKALDFYGKSMQLSGDLDPIVLNRMAFCCRGRGDRDGVRSFYRQAAEAGTWSGTQFNWASDEDRWGNTDRAVELTREAIEIEDDPAYSVFLAQLYQKLGDAGQRDRLVASALPRFGAISGLDAFELSWLAAAARMAGRLDLATEVLDRLHLIRLRRHSTVELEGLLVERAKGEEL